MNVAASSIAPVQPPASPSGVQTASQEGSSGSFADAMQSLQQTSATQPKDTSPKLTPQAQQENDAVPADQAAATPRTVSKEVLPLAQAASLTLLQAALTDKAPHAEPGSSAAVSDLSPAPAQVETTGSTQSPTPESPILTSADEGADLQTNGGLVQPSASAVTPADAAVPAVADAAASKAFLKPASAGDSKSTKKTLHVREANPDSSTTGWVSPIQTKSAVSTPAEVAAAVPSQSTATAAGQQDTTVTTPVLTATRPTAAVPRSTGAAVAAKGSTPALQKANEAPAAVAMTGDATSQGAQAASPPAFTASQGTVGKAPGNQDGPDATGGTVSPENAFSIPALTQAVSSQPTVVFAPSLVIQSASTGPHRVPADVSTSPVGSTPDESSLQSAPVRRLEIAVQDPLLGNVDVRAEMRGGVLHATVTGSQDNATPSMPALHQFLQQHDVAVHSVSYATVREGVTAPASTTFSSSDMTRDTAGGSFAGAPNGGSHGAQGNGSQQQQRYDSSNAGYDDSLFSPASASPPLGIAAANITLHTGSTLSIHI